MDTRVTEADFKQFLKKKTKYSITKRIKWAEHQVGPAPKGSRVCIYPSVEIGLPSPWWFFPSLAAAIDHFVYSTCPCGLGRTARDYFRR